MPNSPKVLVVDDDSRMCESLTALLSNQGYILKTCNSGKKAIEFLNKDDFDLVLLDMFMPDMNGYQIMDYINNQSPDTLVIVITGHASIKSAIKFIKKGAYDYIKKPFEPEELLITVKNGLDHKKLKRENEFINKNQTRLDERIKLLSLAVDQSSEGIGVVDLDGNLEYLNDAFAKMHGYSAEELVGKNLSIFHTPEQMPSVEAANLEIKQKGYFKGEIWHVRRDGTEFPALMRNSLIKDAEGKPIGLLGTLRDITKRKQAEETLRESEEKYRSMMEAMADAAYICSSDFRLEYMNPAMLKRIGRDATGEHCYKAVHGLDGQCPWCVHEKIIQGEHAVHDVVSPKDNRSYHIINSPIHRADDSISKLVVSRDITEIKAMEHQLRQAQKIEAIGILSGGIAHDFNNLLYIIMGNISMTKDEVKPEYGVTNFLNEAEKASLKAKELANQLITFSKGGAPVKKTGSIGDLVKGTTYLSRRGSNVKSELILPDDLWLVEFDEGQMKQAVKNIIDNAVESMPDGGSIAVKAENINISPCQRQHESLYSSAV